MAYMLYGFQDVPCHHGCSILCALGVEAEEESLSPELLCLGGIELVGQLAQAMNDTKRTVEKIDRRVEEIENEPAENWKKICFEVVKGVVLAVVGAALMYFGLS